MYGQCPAISRRDATRLLFSGMGLGGPPVLSQKGHQTGYKLPLTVLSRTEPARKDRQRYGLCLTVFWFRRMCSSKMTVKNTVKSSGYRKHNAVRPYKNILVINPLRDMMPELMIW
jgi:hypothetical protein